MKIILTESQLNLVLTEDRVDFLKNQNVIDQEKIQQMLNPEDEAFDQDAPKRPKKIDVKPVQDHDRADIAYIITKKGKQQVKLTEAIFENIKDADPTRNKEYMQWLIEVFARHIKNGDVDEAVRFVTEDLPEANEFLSLFDSVKNSRLFRLGAKNRPDAPDNPKDIRQYRDLAHLYSVVSPFQGAGGEDDEGEDGVSKLYKNIKKFVDLGQAEIAYHDNDVLVYIPKHIDASCEPLGPLASWCTRRSGNSYFDSYRMNNKRPDGTPSLLYVIMPKELFDMENPAMHDAFPYQFHFESNQIHDKNNRGIGDDGIRDVVNRFPGLAEFFRKELGELASQSISEGTGLLENRYVTYLNKFGGSIKDYVSDDVYQQGVESLKVLAKKETGPINKNKYLKWLMDNTDNTDILSYLDREATALDFSDLNLNGRLPDLTEFKQLSSLGAIGCNITEMPSSDELPESLVILTLNKNNISNIDLSGYEKFQGLFVINCKDNPVTNVDVDTLLKLYTEMELIRLITDDDPDISDPALKERFLQIQDEYGTEGGMFANFG
jgi:hypothetical protein